MERVYLSLGGNIGDALSILRSAVESIKELAGVRDVTVSRYYQTTPVGGEAQSNYVNAACTFVTDIPCLSLLTRLNEIEKKAGKVKKGKNAPRTLDIDILFYGTSYIRIDDFCVPHLRWSERLFVLQPLLDLTPSVLVPVSETEVVNYELLLYLKNFENKHNEIVIAIEEEK